MKEFKVLLTGFLLMPVVGCPIWGGQKQGMEQKTAVQKLSTKEAKEQLDTEPEIILVDVRTPDEYKESHIEGSILLPDYEIGACSEAMFPDKNAKIFVYCRSGMRAEGAAKLLVKQGYTNVTNIGGILNWPYKTVK